MNVTFQTNNFNSNYKKYNQYGNTKNNRMYSGVSPAFKGGIEVPTKSKLLSPFTNAMDKFTTWLSEKYTTKLYTSGFAKFLVKKTDKLNSVVDHMQVMGSVIISGMYMTQTLRNKQLDDDRKKTLAINQGLTFAVSTIGSYVIDDMLDNKWEKLSIKYAAKEMGDKSLPQKLAEINKTKLAEFNAKQEKGLLDAKAKFKPYTVLQYASDNLPHTNIEARLKGMNVLKKLLVFGTVYRFISPVAVTPLATWIGNTFVHKKDEPAKTDSSKPAESPAKPEEAKKTA